MFISTSLKSSWSSGPSDSSLVSYYCVDRDVLLMLEREHHEYELKTALAVVSRRWNNIVAMSKGKLEKLLRFEIIIHSELDFKTTSVYFRIRQDHHLVLGVHYLWCLAFIWSGFQMENHLDAILLRWRSTTWILVLTKLALIISQVHLKNKQFCNTLTILFICLFIINISSYR